MQVLERLGRRKQQAPAPSGADASRAPSGADASRAPAEGFTARLRALLALGDKPTLLFSPRLAAAAEAIARAHEGVIFGEPLARRDRYRTDRLFLSARAAGEAHDVSALADAGHPVVQWTLETDDELAAEPARWDALLPPRSTAALALPGEPAVSVGGLAVFASEAHAQILRKAAGTLGAHAANAPAAWVAAHLALGDADTDCAVLRPDFAATDALHELQGALRDATGLACSLHSGPGTGPQLWLTAGAATPAPIDGARPTLRLHAKTPAKVLAALREAIALLSPR